MWPNSSDSSSVSEKLAQLSATYRCAARDEFVWMKRANTSLPTPLSPVINVLASLAAIRVAAAISSLSAVLAPTMTGAGIGAEEFICSTRRIGRGPHLGKRVPARISRTPRRVRHAVALLTAEATGPTRSQSQNRQWRTCLEPVGCGRPAWRGGVQGRALLATRPA